MSESINRRQWIQAALALAAAASAGPLPLMADVASTAGPKLKKAVKFGMIKLKDASIERSLP